MPRARSRKDLPNSPRQRPWPASGGEMGALVRAHDWASTPLGSIDGWTRELKNAVSLVLECDFPMMVLWGPELIQIYNNAFRGPMALKHPASLGQPTRDSWPEIWNINEPAFARVWRGETVTLTDQLFPIARYGYPEQAYATVCYSPLRDEAGAVAGALVTMVETTQRLRAEEDRERLLRDIDSARARFEAVVENSPVGICAWRGPDLVYEVANPACRLLAPGAQLLGRTYTEVCPEALGAHVSVVRRVLETGEPYHATDVPVRIKRSEDGPIEDAYFNISYTRLPPDAAGQAGVLTLVVETTEQVRSRQRTERLAEELRENGERLRVAIEGAELGTWDWDILTGELVWSDRSLALFGLEPGTAMNYERFLAAVHPEDRERISAAVRRSLELDLEYQVELRCIWPDGSIHWLHARGRRYDDQSGRPVRMIGVALDITDRKRAEEALRESEERLRFVIEGAELGAWDWNIVTGEILWSERTFALFGIRPAGAMSFERFLAAVHPEDRERISAALRRSLDLNAEYKVDYRCIWPDGSIHWLHSLGRHYRDPSGRPVRMTGVVLDITDRKRAEEALRESEERLRLFVENVREYALVQTDVEGRITSWNPGAERLFGYLSAEMLGQPASRLLTPEDRSAGLFDKEFAQVSRGERSEDQRWMVRKDGTRFWVSWVTEAIRDGAGRLRGFSKVLRDETERRRANEVVLQRQKLQSVGLLAGGIAHDFNNILTGITGNASLIMDEVPPGLASRARQILSSAERAAHLTRQLLAYSGRGQFVVQEVDISEAVNAASGLVQFSIPKSVQLALAVETRLPCIEIDPNQLQQIIMNLVINAGEAIGEGNAGKITVATGMSDMDDPFVDAVGQEVAPGRYVWIEVRDTGSGIAEENKSRIFDPFFTTKFTGRGLGLAAVAGIIRAQRGAITVDSEPGRGSTFRVYLPAAGRAAGVQPAATGRATVLVVDDEDTVRDVASVVLSRQGYRVLTAADGHEALALFEREGESIDAAVLDVVMPVMGARDLLPALRSKHPNVKILLTSGYSEAEARRLSGGEPESAFLAKPFTAKQIATAVNELIVVKTKGA